MVCCDKNTQNIIYIKCLKLYKKNSLPAVKLMYADLITCSFFNYSKNILLYFTSVNFHLKVQPGLIVAVYQDLEGSECSDAPGQAAPLIVLSLSL